MPFKSEAQRKFMFSQHPEIAKRWVKEAKSSGRSPMIPNAPFKKNITTKPVLPGSTPPMPIKTGVSPTNPGQARFKNPNITGVSPGQKVGLRKRALGEFTSNSVGRQEGFKRLASQAIKARANQNTPNKGFKRKAE